MKNKRCYLCEGQEFKKRIGKVRDKENLEVLECASCGLVFLSSFEHIKDQFYTDSGMHGEEIIDIKTWIEETERDDQRRYKFLETSLSGRSLLDFGCGTGNFLSKARRQAEKVQGIEPEARLASYFKQMDLEVYRSIKDIPCGNKYDIITMFHVLEHLPDPKETLLEIKKILKSDGQLVVEVPNADDALLTLYGSKAFSNFTYWSCHLYLYNINTLKKLIDQVDMKINYIKQVQRYSIANHLFWLSQEKPGGHEKWSFLDSPELEAAYEAKLVDLGKCDTILVSITKQKEAGI